MRVFDLPESKLVALMEEIERNYAPIKAYSLPNLGSAAIENGAPHIEFGCKAPASHANDLSQAFASMQAAVLQLGGKITALN